MFRSKKDIKQIIAIDPSLNGTGIAYSYKDRLLTTQITFKGSDLKLSHGERFGIITNRIKIIIKNILLTDEYFTPNNIAIWMEQVPFNIGRNKQGHNTLVELHGAIKMMLSTEFNVIPNYVNVSTWKKEIVGNGRADKERIKVCVTQEYNRYFDTFDECDAFCIFKYAERKEGVTPYK